MAEQELRIKISVDKQTGGSLLSAREFNKLTDNAKNQTATKNSPID